MSRAICPTCRAPFDPAKSPTTMPFCSDRCRQIDLGRWLGEQHSIPVPRESPEDEPDELPPEQN